MAYCFSRIPTCFQLIWSCYRKQLYNAEAGYLRTALEADLESLVDQVVGQVLVLDVSVLFFRLELLEIVDHAKIDVSRGLFLKFESEIYEKIV